MRTLWEDVGSPSNWSVLEGSVLDTPFISGLGNFDVVYSWGVLHHTGNMWAAVDNACRLVGRGGICWIAFYKKGPKYKKHLVTKRRYNAGLTIVKRLMVLTHILRLATDRLMHRRNPFTWNQPTSRGMDVFHDIVDWLGGLPYEVASTDEVLSFLELRVLSRCESRKRKRADVASLLVRRRDEN
jgi:hypothetical protein